MPAWKTLKDWVKGLRARTDESKSKMRLQESIKAGCTKPLDCLTPFPSLPSLLLITIFLSVFHLILTCLNCFSHYQLCQLSLSFSVSLLLFCFFSLLSKSIYLTFSHMLKALKVEYPTPTLQHWDCRSSGQQPFLIVISWWVGNETF